jgi:membrane protein
MHPKRLASVLMRTYTDWSADSATRLGAALAYYTLFSIAPVLIVITGVIGFFVGQAAAREELTPWLQRFLSPEGARAAELMLQQHVTPAGGIITTLIGLVTLFLATSAFVNELRQSINLVWRVQLPPSENQGLLGTVRAMVTDRVYGFLLAIGAAVLVMVSVIINTTITVAGSYFNGALPLPAPALHLINFVISFLLMVSVFTLVYKTLPDAYVAWGDAAVGAIVTAFLFDVGSLLLSTFIGHTAIHRTARCQRARHAGVGLLLGAGVLLRRGADAHLRDDVWRRHRPGPPIAESSPCGNRHDAGSSVDRLSQTRRHNRRRAADLHSVFLKESGFRIWIQG